LRKGNSSATRLRAAIEVSLRNIEFLIHEAFVGIRRNGVMALASLSTIALSLAVLGAFVLLIFGATNMIQRELGKFDIAVYLTNDTSREEALRLGGEIRRMRAVKEVDFIPKEVAWPQFKKERAGKLDLGGLKGNPLPDAYRVKVSRAEMVEELADRIRAMRGVASVREGREVLRHVLAAARFIRYVGAVAIGALFITCVFIISNSIRLTIFARRREIRIMQLVGATDWFIRIPLVIEGMVLGSLGAAVSVALIRLSGYYLSGVVARELPLLRQASSGIEPGQFAAGLILTGTVVGTLGSMASIRKFL